MIGFWVVNLLPPHRPENFVIKTPLGEWEFFKAPGFAQNVEQVAAGGGCANLYGMSFEEGHHDPEDVIAEALRLCLALSYCTGMAVTVRNSLQASRVLMAQPGPHFPRDRAMVPCPCVDSLAGLVRFSEAFLKDFASVDAKEKLLLLSHHLIDSISCWSLEDLYLSGSTLLQVIAATEEDTGRVFAKNHAIARTGKPNPSVGFFDYLAGAADRVGIAALQHDIVKLRNSLIHEGTLSHPVLPTKSDACRQVADAMNWVDQYVFARLSAGPVPRARMSATELAHSLNSFSY